MKKRIQRKRTRGWRKPPGAIFVGRPSKWGNPYFVGTDKHNLNPYCCKTNKEAVDRFKRQLELLKMGHQKCVLRFELADLAELKGKVIMCWCREDEPYCHGDILLELANKD